MVRSATRSRVYSRFSDQFAGYYHGTDVAGSPTGFNPEAREVRAGPGRELLTVSWEEEPRLNIRVPRLVRSALVALLAVIICNPAYALAGTSSDPTVTEQQKKIDALTTQIQQMQQQQTELINELKEVKKEIAVPTPAASPGAEAAAAPTAPKTIGDYVAQLEKTKVPTTPAQPIPPASWPVAGIYTAPDTKDIGQISGFEWLNGVKIRGLIDTYYDYNFNHPNQAVVNANQGFSVIKGHNISVEGRTFDVNNQSFSFSQAQLEIEKVPDVGGVGFDLKLAAGQTPDIIFNTINGGLGPEAPGQPLSGSDRYLEQASLDYIAPIGQGLRIDIGKFVTHIGGETIETVKNLNYSHSFFYTYAIPFQDSGIHLDYPWTGTFYTDFYLLNGWNATIDNNLGKTFGPSIGWTPWPWLSLVGNYLYGPEQFNNSAHKRQLFDSQVMVGPFAGWNFMANYDLGYEERVVARRDALWMGPALYARYAINEWLEPSIRGEYYWDRDGFTTGVPQSIYGLTATLNTKIPIGKAGASMLLVRPELRWDHSNASFFSNHNKFRNRQNQITLGVGTTWFF